jgi:hypothetical protein
MRKVAEAAVVGYPHDIKGQGIYCYVTLMEGEEPTTSCARSWSSWVRAEIGPIASPDLIQWAPGLPKTRSGKIMRRILRKIADDDFDSARRHLDAGRPGGGRRPDREPPSNRRWNSRRPPFWGGLFDLKVVRHAPAQPSFCSMNCRGL